MAYNTFLSLEDDEVKLVEVINENYSLEEYRYTQKRINNSKQLSSIVNYGIASVEDPTKKYNLYKLYCN